MDEYANTNEHIRMDNVCIEKKWSWEGGCNLVDADCHPEVCCNVVLVWVCN